MQKRCLIYAVVAIILPVIFLSACNTVPPVVSEVIYESDSQTNNETAEIPRIISNMRAREIAEVQVGRGTSGSVNLFNENGVMTFEVEIIYEDTRYTVFINAENGAILRLNQYHDLADEMIASREPQTYHEPPTEQEPVVTPAPQQTPEPTPSPAPETTPAAAVQASPS